MRTFPLIVAASFVIGSSLFADSSDDLNAFVDKLKKSLASKQTDRAYGAEAAQQFEVLSIALKRGDFERAQQLIQNLGAYGVPPELRAEWQALADDLAAKIVEMQQQAAIDWKKSVDGVAAKAKEACSAAKSSADLDEVMIEIAALQMKRVSSNNILSQRATQKLEGTARFLDQWARFLDCRDAGETNQANNILQELSRGGGFPVLSAAELQKFASEGAYTPDNAIDAARFAFRDVETADQLPAAVERARELLKKPSLAREARDWNFSSVLEMCDAEEAIDQGRLADARAKLISQDSSNLVINVPALRELRSNLLNRLATAEVAEIAGGQLSEGQSVGAFLSATLDRLQAEGKFAEMAKIMARVGELQRGINLQNVPWSPNDPAALAAYASGAQLEAAGDALAAINEYRRAITSGQTGKYAPTKQAEEALARLRQSHPAAFEDANGVVLEELRQIRQDLQRAMMMQRRMPPY